MRHQRLRQITQNELRWHQLILLWRQRGHAVETDLTPGSDTNLLYFRTDTGWEGYIDLNEWFARVMPDSAAMSSAAWQPEELAQLFTHSIKPLEGLPDELSYYSLEIITPKTTPQNLSVSISAAQGRLWLSFLPEKLVRWPAAGELNTTVVPFKTLFSIGHSYLSLNLLKTIKSGDVLFINKQENRVIFGGNATGAFYKVEGGLMYESIQDDNEDLLEENDDWDESENSVVQEHILIDREKVKVKISFLLQQSYITLGELESFYQGMVIPCKQDAENNIIITANGVAIARGELVWLEDRPGVEIIAISPEAQKDAKQ